MESNPIRTSWTDDLATGIDMLDAQHHEYLELLDRFLHDAAANTPNPKIARDLSDQLDFLRNYAHEHFSAEETIMKLASYPDTAQHKQEHLFFLDRVDELRGRMNNLGFSPGLAREVKYYALEWFIDHIRSADVDLVNFLKEHAGRNRAIQAFLEK